ncbi:MAG: PAS domain S-box protein [Desulfovibrionaceae bacterium]
MDHLAAIPPAAFEALLENASDLVLLADDEGVVRRANRRARETGGEDIVGAPFWKLFEPQAHDLQDALSRFEQGRMNHVGFRGCSAGFALQLARLHPAGAGDSAYLLMLTNTDISLADQALLLTHAAPSLADHAWPGAQEVRGADLKDSRKLFRTLFHSPGQPILLADVGGQVVGANRPCAELFGRPAEEFLGQSIWSLLPPQLAASLQQRLAGQEDGDVVSQEGCIVSAHGADLPVRIRMRKVQLEDRCLAHLALEDVSTEIELQERIQEERAQTQDMSQTLRTVIKAIGEERRDLRGELASTVKLQIRPALKRMVRETDRDVRAGYSNLIMRRLAELTDGADDELDAGLLELTPTELEVCRRIQAGMSSKHLARDMNSSFETIQTHRKNIRRKLGLTGRSKSLFSYLQNKNL